MKPSDFLIGVLDFFAILLPGAAATWLLLQYLPPEVRKAYIFAAEEPTSVQWVLTLLTAYGVGHFVFMAGSNLDKPLYEPWRRRTKSGPADVAYPAARKLRERVTKELVGDSLSTFTWARTYVGIHSSEARLEIDRIEANSKLFRSLIVIAAAFAGHCLLVEREIAYAAAATVVCYLSVVRYREQRWKATELTYASAIISYRSKNGGASDRGQPPAAVEDASSKPSAI